LKREHYEIAEKSIYVDNSYDLFIPGSQHNNPANFGRTTMNISKKRVLQKVSPGKGPNPKPITINVATSALLMLHWQNDLVKPEGKVSQPYWKRIREDNTIANARKTLEAARKKEMLVIFVNVGFQSGYPELSYKKEYTTDYYKRMIHMMKEEGLFQQGTWGSDNIDELRPLKNEPIIWNYGTSAFEDTALDRILRNRGIKSLFLSGITTNHVVETTARTASDKGYRNYILMDCCNTSSKDLHSWPLANTMVNMAVITDSANFIDAINKPNRFSDP
jgi:nicotinamidase-related amidase